MKRTLKCSYFEALSICSAYIPFAFLALIPTIFTTPETILSAVMTYGLNLLFVTLIFIYGIFKTSNKVLILEKPETLCFKSGIIEKRSAYFAEKSIKSLIVEKSIFSMLFNSRRVIFNTGSKTGKNGNFSMFLSRKNERRLMHFLFTVKNDFKTIYKAGLFNIILMAISSSNAIAGIIIFIPFLNKTGQLFGEHYKTLIYSSLDLSPQMESVGIPPVSAGIAGILIIGLIISVFTVVLNYGFFRIEKSQNSDAIIIKRGFPERKFFITFISQIAAFQIRQSLLMLLFKKCSLKFFSWGQRRESQNKRVMIPYLDIESGNKFLETRKSSKSFIARPPDSARKAYLYFPAFLISLLCLFCIAGSYIRIDTVPIFPLIVFAFVMLILLFVMRVFAHKKAFLYADNKKAAVSFYKRLSFIKTLIPLSKISGIKITQSIFQQYSRLCNVYIYVYGENKRCFKIKHLSLSDGIEFSKRICHSS